MFFSFFPQMGRNQKSRKDDREDRGQRSRTNDREDRDDRRRESDAKSDTNNSRSNTYPNPLRKMARGNRRNNATRLTQENLQNALAKSQSRQSRPEFRKPFTDSSHKRQRQDRSESTRSTSSTAKPAAKRTKVSVQPLPKGPRKLIDFRNSELGVLKAKLREKPIPRFPLPEPKLRKKFDTDSIFKAGVMFHHVEDIDKLILFATPSGQVFIVKNFEVPDYIKNLLEDVYIAKVGDPMHGRIIEIRCNVAMIGNLRLDPTKANSLVPIFKPEQEDEVMLSPRDEYPDLYPLAVHNIRKSIWLFWANVSALLPKPVKKE